MAFDINVHIVAEKELLEVLKVIAGGSMLGKLVRDNSEELKALANETKAVETKETAPQKSEASPAPAPKAKKPKLDPNAKVDQEGVVKLRDATRVLSSARGIEGKTLIKAWLDEHGLKRVPDMTNGQAVEYLRFITEETAPGKGAKENA